jgi:hypothetical protein
MPHETLRDRVRRHARQRLGEPLQRHVIARVRRLRNAGRGYQPIFVAGASGSGTSLVAASLAQRFDCAGLVYESNLQVSRSSFLYVPDIDVFASPSAYQNAMGPQESWSVDLARDDMLEMYRSYAWGPSDVVVDKGPDTNLLRAEFLARCFPEARFVLIYRDPVANIEGLRRKWKTFGSASLGECIRFYSDVHERFLAALPSFPERVLAVEYEKLVDRYDETLSRIGERFELEAARRRLRLPTRPNLEGMGVRNVRGSRIGVVKDATRRAVDRLDPADAERIRAALGPLHARLRSLPFGV